MLNESRQHKQTAWLIAALTRTKKLPAFESFVGIQPTVKPKQTWQEMKAALRAIAGHADHH